MAYTYRDVRDFSEYYKDAQTALSPDLEKAKTNINTASDTQKKSTTDIYNAQIDDTAIAYEDSYRDNAVQKEINKREVAENMASLGLTNSGLNRTQQTAVQLSYANNKAKIDIQKQAAVDALARTLATELANIEANRVASISDVENKYSQLATDNATSQRNADIEYNQKVAQAEADEAIAQIEADTEITKYNTDAYYKWADEQQQQMNDDTTNLYAHLNGNNTDPDYTARLIIAYCQKYDIDPSSNANITALLKAAGLSLDDLTNYATAGTTYISNADYTSGVAKGTKIKWDYKTGGKQKYKIHVKKDTTNWLWGADKNDVVDIYYSDGTLLAEDVKLSSLSKSVGKEITKITKGNEGKTKTLEIDLSKEKF